MLNDIQTQEEIKAMRKSTMEQLIALSNRTDDIMKDIRADKYTYAQLSKLMRNLDLTMKMLKEE